MGNIACHNLLKDNYNNMFIDLVRSSATIYKRPNNIQILFIILSIKTDYKQTRRIDEIIQK